MYTLRGMGKTIHSEIKKDYPETDNPHYFALGSSETHTFFLCREFTETENPNDYQNTVTVYDDLGNTSHCQIICKTATIEEMDKIILLYLKTLKINQDM